MSDFQFALDIAQIASGLGAAGAAVVAFMQSRQTREQMDHTMRAWVGIDADRNRLRPEGIMEFHMKNYGQIPATKLRFWSGCQLQAFTKEQIKSTEKRPNDAEGSLLPGGYHTVFVAIPDLKRLISERLAFYYYIRIEYYYSKNKFGSYELIGQNNIAKSESSIDYELVE